MGTKILNDKQFPHGLRTGDQYIEAIRNDGRRVIIDGKEVNDVTTHPAFSEAVRTIASLYDISSDPANREVMSYASPVTGDPVNRIWQLPRSEADLHARRSAIERWSEATFGLMGRTPDHVAGFLPDGQWLLMYSPAMACLSEEVIYWVFTNSCATTIYISPTP